MELLFLPYRDTSYRSELATKKRTYN